MKNEGPLTRSFALLSGGDDEPAVLNGDTHLLASRIDLRLAVKCRPHSNEFVALLGLYYYKARFYASRIGRFLQTDPLGMKDDPNLYAYVGNNPANRADPTGLAKVGVGDKTAVQMAAAGDLKCLGFSAGCQNGGSYGSTGAYKVNGLVLCPSGAVKMPGADNESPAEREITLELYMNTGGK